MHLKIAIIVHGAMKLLIPLLLGCIFKSISATNSKQPGANPSTIEEAPSSKQEKHENGWDGSGNQENQNATSIESRCLEHLLQERQKAYLNMREESKQFNKSFTALISIGRSQLDRAFKQKKDDQMKYRLDSVRLPLESGDHLLKKNCHEVYDNLRHAYVRIGAFYPDGSSELLSFDAACKKYWESATFANESFISKMEEHRNNVDAKFEAIKAKVDEQIFLANAAFETYRVEYDNFDTSIALREARFLLAEKKEGFYRLVGLLEQPCIPHGSYNPSDFSAVGGAAMAREILKLKKDMHHLALEIGLDIVNKESELERIKSDFSRNLDGSKSQLACELDKLRCKMLLLSLDSSHLIERILYQEEQFHTLMCSKIPELLGEKNTRKGFLEQKEFTRHVRDELVRSIKCIIMKDPISISLLQRAQQISNAAGSRFRDIKSFFATRFDVQKIESVISVDVNTLFSFRNKDEVFFESVERIIVENELKERLKSCQEHAQFHYDSDYLLELVETKKSLLLALENFDEDLEIYTAVLLKESGQFLTWQKVLADELASAKGEYQKMQNCLSGKNPIDKDFLDNLKIERSISALQYQEIEFIKEAIRLLAEKSTRYIEVTKSLEGSKDADKQKLISSISALDCLIDDAECTSDGSLLAHLYEEWAEKAKAELLLSIREKYEPRLTDGK